MRVSSKFWRWFGAGLLGFVALVWVVRAWVIPAVIVGQIQSRIGGPVTIDTWWLNGQSAGISGLTVHERSGADAPVLATVERIETDLTIGGILRGRFTPGRVMVRRPIVTVRLNREGQPLMHFPESSGGEEQVSLPKVIIQEAQATFEQEGRPPLVVHGIDGELTPRADGVDVSAQTDDPYWGPWRVSGSFGSDFRKGQLELVGQGVRAEREKLLSIPFVPAETWQNVLVTGPVDTRLALHLDQDQTPPLSSRVEVQGHGAVVDLPMFKLSAEGTTGTVVVEDGVVRLSGIEGRAMDGQIGVNGTMDFAHQPPEFDLDLKLTGVNVADAPSAWQLGQMGLSGGKMSGQADIKVVLAKDLVDLSGSSGEATIRDGVLEGIPVKSLKLVMTAHGNELQYDTADSGSSAWRTWLIPGLIGLQVPPTGTTAPKPAGPGEPKAAAEPEPGPAGVKVAPNAEKKGVFGGFKLPKALTTEIELEDVDLSQLLAKGEALGISLPVPASGKVSIKAKATIPLGQLRDMKAYTFHGEATLKSASIAGVGLAHVLAHLDLENGVLDLTDLRGRLADVQPGDKAEDLPPVEGPLPPGGFRGRLRAELDPKGTITGHLEGNQMPLAELSAPALPASTPLSGLASLNLDVEGRADALEDPKAWSAQGRIDSERITFRGTTLDALASSFALKEGHLDVSELTARLAGQPLKANGGVDLAAPYAFDGALEVDGWDVSDLLAFVPGAPQPAPADGLLTARAEAKGTISPLYFKTHGSGTVARCQVERVSLGNVPFRWATEGDVIAITGVEAHPFGGRITAEAKVPIRGDQPISGSAQLIHIDTAQLAALMPGGDLKMTGLADGQVEFLAPTQPAPAGSGPEVEPDLIKANVQLSAPNLTVQGLNAQGVSVSLWVRKGELSYEIVAEGLGGKIKFRGDVPLAAIESNRGSSSARFRAVGFSVVRLAQALGLNGAPPGAQGLGAVDANLRLDLPGPNIWARGLAEIRGLRLRADSPEIGWLRGTVTLTPRAWRVDPLTGQLWGGQVAGSAWSRLVNADSATTETVPQRDGGFELTLDRANLSRALAGFRPDLAQRISGTGSLRLGGQLDQTFSGSGTLSVREARVRGLPLGQLRLPLDLSWSPEGNNGSLRIQRFSARLAGGQVRGNALFRLGSNQAFSGDLTLSNLDLETLTRIVTDWDRPASGLVSGRITWQGRALDPLRGLRGKLDLDLRDADLFDLPVFRQMSLLLGSGRGGTFEVGDFEGTLTDRVLVVEQLSLAGRIVQMHATGTVTYTGQLDLDVVVNTNQIISQSGQALLGTIPGLRNVLGRRDQAMTQVRSFLSNRLIKMHVSGTLNAPVVNIDPTVLVTEGTAAFFIGVFGLPLGL